MTVAYSRPVAVATVCIRLHVGLVAEILGLAAGYARSAAIAAILGDMRAASVRIEQARLCVVAALEVISEQEYRNQGKVPS